MLARSPGWRQLSQCQVSPFTALSLLVSCHLIVGSQHVLGRMKWHLEAGGTSPVGAWDSCCEVLPPCLMCLISDKSSSTENSPGQVAPGLNLSSGLRW